MYLHRNPEGEPYFPFNSQVGHHDACPNNTAIYLHPFENKGVDHIFVAIGETEETYEGIFLWRIVVGEMFDDLVEEMQEDFQVVIADEVGPQDQKAFDGYVDTLAVEVTDEMIREWVDEH